MHTTTRPTRQAAQTAGNHPASTTAPAQGLCVIIHGPANSGKTLNAPAISNLYGLRLLVDNWDDSQPLRPGALHLTRQTRQQSRHGVMVLDVESALWTCRHFGLLQPTADRFGVVNPSAWAALKASVSAHSSTAAAIQYAEDWAAMAEDLIFNGHSKHSAFETAEVNTYPANHEAAGPTMRQFALATLQRHWVFGGELATWNAMRRALTPAPAVDMARNEA